MTDQLADSDGSLNIYCPDDTCPPERDWIVMDLEPGVILPLGSVCLIAGIAFLVKYRHKGNLMYEKNGISLSMLMLGLSILLRAAVGLKTDHKEALYVASMVLDFHAGQCIYANLFVNLFCINTHWEHSKRGLINIAVSTNQTLGLFAVAVCGAVLMFHPTTKTRAGINCFRVTLSIMLVMTLIIIVTFVYRLKVLRQRMAPKIIASSVLVSVLLVFWCTFMLARTFVGLSSPARSSPGMLIWFNYIPLCFCFVFTSALGEPFIFDAEDTQPLSACQGMELVGLEHGNDTSKFQYHSDHELAGK